MDSNDRPANPRPPQYEIRVQGRLGSHWAASFDGMRLSAEPDGTTALRGPIADQAALHGLIRKLRDVGLVLVSLHQVSDDAPIAPTTQPSSTPPEH